ncbi:hypothetical protein STENM36S_08170 [Streptomyces tendae]
MRFREWSILCILEAIWALRVYMVKTKGGVRALEKGAVAILWPT